MSTRYVKRDNVVLVGVAKNGSQSIKQLAFRQENIKYKNDGFEIREEQGDWNQDNFIDWNDSNLLILFPIRHWQDKAVSELKEIIVTGVEMGETFRPRLSYFDNNVIKYFIENILFNENWNGAQVRFFELEHLSTRLPKYLGWDIEIPYINTSEENPQKQILMKQLKDIKIKIPSVDTSFFKGIKKSKYWIEL